MPLDDLYSLYGCINEFRKHGRLPVDHLNVITSQAERRLAENDSFTQQRSNNSHFPNKSRIVQLVGIETLEAVKDDMQLNSESMHVLQEVAKAQEDTRGPQGQECMLCRGTLRPHISGRNNINSIIHKHIIGDGCGADDTGLHGVNEGVHTTPQMLICKPLCR